MQIDGWVKSRATKGTVADLARRMLAKDKPYAEMEKRLKQCYMLEALVANEGDYERAAAAIGVCRHTISRALKEGGFGVKEVRMVVAHVRGGR